MCLVKTFLRETGSVPASLQEGLHHWRNRQEEHSPQVDCDVPCYGLCQWRGWTFVFHFHIHLVMIKCAMFLVIDYVNGEVVENRTKDRLPHKHCKVVEYLSSTLYEIYKIDYHTNISGWTLYKRSKISAEEQEANSETGGSRWVAQHLHSCPPRWSMY